MVRLLGLLVLVLVALSLLRSIPGVGRWLGGFWGFWLVALALGAGLGWLTGFLARRRRLSGELRQLGEVDSPHNRGKLGSLLLANGRARHAVPHLESAVRGEPEVAEWHYRLGLARRAVGRSGEALEALEVAARIDAEHAYGGVQLALAGARLECGEAEGALEALETFERNHGASPESCYRRGLSLRCLGRGAEARASFARVGELAGRAARFQRAQNRPWVWRALLRRLLA